MNYGNGAGHRESVRRTPGDCDRFDGLPQGLQYAATEKTSRGFRTSGYRVRFYLPQWAHIRSSLKLGVLEPTPTGPTRRIEVTKDEADEFVFKVPSLRNIALTWPYCHDGKHSKLPEAVREMGRIQLGQNLTDEQVDNLAAFLGTLSDKGRKVPERAGAKGPSEGAP